MQRLNTWVINPFAPTDHNVGWIDTSDEKGWVARMYNGAHVEDVPNPTPEQLGWDPVAGITEEEIKKLLDAKQDTLISGENIKTLGNKDLLGEGNIAIKLTTNASTPNILRIKLDSDTASSQAFKTINGETLLGEGDISIPTESDIVWEKGQGTNSVQQKGTGAEAMSESSIATGVDSFAGQRGYKYTNTGNVTNQLTLTSVDGLAVGDVVSIVNDSKYPNCSTITGINGTTVTFDSLPFDSIEPDLTGFDDYLVYVSEKPNVGDVELAIASHAEGAGTKAQNYTAHAEGRDTKALGEYSHAEGRGTVAQYAAHAEGKGTEASGEESHSEGINTKSLGKHAHAEGDITEATNYNAHAEGYFSKAYGNSSHAEGGKWVKGATGATRINGGTANGDGSHAEGGKTVSEGNFSHAEGYLTIANENNSHAEGQNSRTGGETRPSLGGTSGSQNSHAEGSGTWANGLGAHSEGGHTVASGNYSHAEGYETQAGGLTKLGPNSHTEGFKTSTGDTTLFDTTSANANTTPGAHAHAEGNVTVAVGRGSHVEGEKTKAEGIASHAEGNFAHTIGNASHAEGIYTIANNRAEHAEGHYNKSNKASDTFGDLGNTLHSVGIGAGSGTTPRKNAFEIMQNGDAYLYGIGGYDGTNPTNSKTIKKVIDLKQDVHIQSDPAEFTFIEEGKWYDALEGNATQICAPSGAINTTISCFIFNPSSSVETLECYKGSGDFGSDITTIYIQPGAYIKLTATIDSSYQATWTIVNSVVSSAVSNIVSMSQTDYDNLQNKDASTLYIIV